MKFERVTYSESIEAVNEIGNKKWFKAGADIVDIEENELPQATQLAKQYVSQTLAKSLAENPMYIPLPASQKEIKVSEGKTDQLTTEQRLIADINTCTDLKILQSYELLTKKYPTVKEAYDKKLTELTK